VSSSQRITNNTLIAIDLARAAVESGNLTEADEQVSGIMRNLAFIRQAQAREAVEAMQTSVIQEAYFAIIGQTDSNEFDGAKIVQAFRDNPDIWDAVMPDLSLDHNLCALTEGGAFVDTIYVRCKTEDAGKVKALGKRLAADERDVMEREMASYGSYSDHLFRKQASMGYVIVRLWWD
jgi:hypothetical protein